MVAVVYPMLGLTKPEAWTASGYGTTHKGVNTVSHFATFPPIPSTNGDESKANPSSLPWYYPRG